MLKCLKNLVISILLMTQDRLTLNFYSKDIKDETNHR